MLHFAYGSNMDRLMMGRRCPGAQLAARAELRGYRFVIMRPGFGNIVPARGGIVHGVLWRLTPRDLAALHAYENIAGGLYRAAVMAVAVNRRRVPALVYVASKRAAGRPKSGYMELVTSAARDIGLPSGYIRSIGRTAAAAKAAPAPRMRANGR